MRSQIGLLWIGLSVFQGCVSHYLDSPNFDVVVAFGRNFLRFTSRFLDLFGLCPDLVALVLGSVWDHAVIVLGFVSQDVHSNPAYA